jgi:ADP-ribose pyrophosphatase YjhB (NUDIX family)
VEWDEDVYDAIRREFLEETGLHIRVEKVYTVESNFHNPEIQTVGIWFQAEVVGGELKAGDDISVLEYFPLDNLPPLAFHTDYVVIEKLKKE